MSNSPFYHKLLHHQNQTREDNDQRAEQHALMDRIWSTNPFNTSKAISLIAFLLTMNGYHLTITLLLGHSWNHLHTRDLIENTADGVSCLIHVIYNVLLVFCF
ncbi:hypothetical protein XENORESO_003330 [Xenotaenia resolanae]|uniref:Uncharacterized protein n=1 Tax=Xenotaenia resolanae TaxID=208358 RepID=A0ABV0VP02_9TELE